MSNRLTTAPLGAVVTAAGAKDKRYDRRQERDQRDDDEGQPEDAVGDVIDAVSWPRTAWSQAIVSNA